MAIRISLDLYFGNLAAVTFTTVFINLDRTSGVSALLLTCTCAWLKCVTI